MYNICMRNKTEMVRKDFYLTKKQVEILNNESSMLGITFSEVLRRILDSYIKEKNKCQDR